MTNTEKLLAFLRANNVFEAMYRSGSTPDEVRSTIVETLKPFFRNMAALDRYVLDFLVPDFVNLLRARTRYPGIYSDIMLVLDAYHEAADNKGSILFPIIRELRSTMIETGDRFWAFVNLEKDKSQLEIHEFVKTSFDDIAGLVEELLKPHIVEQIVLTRLLRDKTVDLRVLQNTKLGLLVDELVQYSMYPHLFAVRPEGLKLSTWRNIASHRSYHVTDQQIACEYHIGTKMHSLVLSRDQLFARVREIARSLEVLNFAHKFFGFDKMDVVAQTGTLSGSAQTGPPGRPEVWMLFYVTGLNSLGFDVLELRFCEGGEALLVVQDLTEEDPKSRGIHTSQFTYSLWLWTGAATVTVEYRLKNDKQYLRSVVTADVCQAIHNGERGIDHLASNVQFTLLYRDR